eukprot:scaffold23499_cov109-Cylindrotheca_fusiformis.AAC.7
MVREKIGHGEKGQSSVNIVIIIDAAPGNRVGYSNLEENISPRRNDDTQDCRRESKTSSKLSLSSTAKKPTSLPSLDSTDQLRTKSSAKSRNKFRKSRVVGSLDISDHNKKSTRWLSSLVEMEEDIRALVPSRSYIGAPF